MVQECGLGLQDPQGGYRGYVYIDLCGLSGLPRCSSGRQLVQVPASTEQQMPSAAAQLETALGPQHHSDLECVSMYLVLVRAGIFELCGISSCLRTLLTGSSTRQAQTHPQKLSLATVPCTCVLCCCLVLEEHKKVKESFQVLVVLAL